MKTVFLFRWLPIVVLLWLAGSMAQAFQLSTPTLLEGCQTGTDSVQVQGNKGFTSWTATPNVSWLHSTSSGNQVIGTVSFTFDANPNASPRYGTITVGPSTLMVIQAGTSANANTCGPLALLLPSDSGFVPWAVATDSSDDVYFTDTTSGRIIKWEVLQQVFAVLVSGLTNPQGLVVDSSGDVFFTDSSNKTLQKWTASNRMVSTLVSTGLSVPQGIAIDGSGNIFIADNGSSSIKEWQASNQTLTTVVSSGLSFPEGVAVDTAGNLYIADGGDFAIKKWTAGTGVLSTLASSSGIPIGVTVDSAGNVYYTDNSQGIFEWLAATQIVRKVSASPGTVPCVDSFGNLYVSEPNSGEICMIRPVTTPSAATALNGGFATVNGTADPVGTANTTAYFEYGTTTSYGSTTPATSVSSGSSSVPVTFGLLNLAKGATYHYQMVLNSGGSYLYYSGDQTFTTPTTSFPSWHSAQISALSNPSMNNMADGARTGAVDTGRQQYYYKGTDNNIWCIYLAGSVWTQVQLSSDGNVNDWLTFGGTPGLLTYLGKDNQIWSLYWTGSKWATAQLGTVPGGVTVAGDLAIDNAWNTVYFRDTNALLHCVVLSGKTWVYSSIGTNPTANIQGSMKVDPKYHQVYYQSLDNQMWCYSWTGKAWTQVQLTTTANVGGAISVDEIGLTVYYRLSTDNSAGCVYWNGKTFVQEALVASANINASATSFSDTAPYTAQYNNLYIDGNNQAEVFWFSGSAWTHGVLGDGASSLTGGLSVQPQYHWIFARRSDGNIIIFWYQ